MEKNLLLFAMLISGHFIFAQAPQAINYQAVVRDSAGNLMANQVVKLGFRLHDGSASGSVVYCETDSGQTNESGLFTLVRGK